MLLINQKKTHFLIKLQTEVYIMAMVVMGTVCCLLTTMLCNSGVCCYMLLFTLQIAH